MTNNRLTSRVSHTPGPWHTFHDGPNPWWIVRADGRDVADVESSGQAVVWNERKRPETVRANALLIAAAPDLLALAKQYADECVNCAGVGRVRYPGLSEPSPCRDCADIRAVIDKAEGRI